MLNASHKTLKILAALVWSSGAVVLFIKSSTLLLEAESIKPGQNEIWLALFGGLTFGAIKAKYLFCRLCYKNLNRIDKLLTPKLWQFYRMHFFAFLLLMVSLGSYLSRLAHGDYLMLISMAFVELSVATALLGSSHCFWKKQADIGSAG